MFSNNAVVIVAACRNRPQKMLSMHGEKARFPRDITGRLLRLVNSPLNSPQRDVQRSLRINSMRAIRNLRMHVRCSILQVGKLGKKETRLCQIAVHVRFLSHLSRLLLSLSSMRMRIFRTSRLVDSGNLIHLRHTSLSALFALFKRH